MRRGLQNRAAFLCLMSDSSGTPYLRNRGIPGGSSCQQKRQSRTHKTAGQLGDKQRKDQAPLDGHGKAEMRGQRGSAADKKSGIHNFAPRIHSLDHADGRSGADKADKQGGKAAVIHMQLSAQSRKRPGKAAPEKLRRRGDSPSMTIPMDATTCIASSSGIREGSSFILPIYCTAPSVSPIRERARRNLAKPPNTFRLFCGAKWRQSISAAEKSRIGMLSFRRGEKLHPSGKTAEYLRRGHGNKTDQYPSGKSVRVLRREAPCPSEW